MTKKSDAQPVNLFDSDPDTDNGGGIDSAPDEGFEGGETGDAEGSGFSKSGSEGANSSDGNDPGGLDFDVPDIGFTMDGVIEAAEKAGHVAFGIVEGHHLIESGGPIIIVPKGFFNPNKKPPEL